jgi:hypothetical protein
MIARMLRPKLLAKAPVPVCGRCGAERRGPDLRILRSRPVLGGVELTVMPPCDAPAPLRYRKKYEAARCWGTIVLAVRLQDLPAKVRQLELPFSA